MSEIRPKDPNLLKAQVATFTAERVKEYSDRRHIFENIGMLAAGPPKDVKRTVETTEYRNEDGQSVVLEKGTEIEAASAQNYLDFMHEVRGSANPRIKERQNILSAYKRFAPIVKALKKELKDPGNRKSHIAFLGNGSNATAFTIRLAEQDYVVRVPNGTEAKPESVDSHIAGSIHAIGIPRIEHIVAASYEDGVTIAERIPGKQIGQLSPQEIDAISTEQLSDLANTILAGHKAGVEFDAKPSNIIYDADAGFGIVDIHSSLQASKTSDDQDPAEILSCIPTWIYNMGNYGNHKKNYHDKTAKDLKFDLVKAQANLNLMNRFSQALAEIIPSKYQHRVRDRLQVNIESVSSHVNNLSDPEWVSNTLKEYRKMKKEDAEAAARRKQNAATGGEETPLIVFTV